ncbi:single-stranded DNA-binding protein [Kiloniella sp.]|uniref:single-stranded DNA-binding protein n=1 Tax=Kiloniella sp. TaxID=1938587 RepID=UPI003B02C6F9
MAGSLNKVTIIGNLGRDVDVLTMGNGNQVANLNIATSESWKDKQTGEKRERTEWHRVVIFNKHLVGIAQQYLHKGSKVYLEGQMQTRKWTDNNGVEKYTTEVVLAAFDGVLVMLDGKNDNAGNSGGGGFGGSSGGLPKDDNPNMDDLDDEIPL